MRYALLIYTNEAEDAANAATDGAAVMAGYAAFGRDFKDQIVGGDALMPTSDATSVRLRQGETLITDGPFAETKEQLGGYYVVEAANLDEATKIAARIPGGQTGTIEVRPIMAFD